MNTKFFGLTGGIGAGKSTVAKMFADLDVPTLDLDKIGRTILSQAHIQQQLVKTFGKHILQENSINRNTLRETAFESKTNTQKLNNIMHPAIRQAEMFWRKEQTAPFAIIEASVLIESGDIQRMNGLIVVLADLNIRQQRVLARGKQGKENFNAIVQRQCCDQERTEAATYTIDNNTDLRHLKDKVDKLYQQLV